MSSARVLVVDDEPDIRDLLREILEDEGYTVTVAGDAEHARIARREDHPDIALLDIWMPDVDGITLLNEWHGGEAPGFPVIMMSGHGTIETAVEATRLGAFDFVEKPLSLAKLLVTVRNALGSVSTRGGDGGRAPLAPRRDLIGTSRSVVDLRDRIARLAHGSSPVLVRGEPGTGKRTTAALLHEQGERARQPRIELDLGAVGSAAAVDALFGDNGAWQRAAAGTLVINDLAELPLAGQAALFERLEQGSGAGAPRLVALTAEDLPTLVDAGRFRADLYHSLNATVVHVPALRDHAEDLPELLSHFVDRMVARDGLVYRRFTVAAQNRLRHYDWPGNVAELASLVRHLLTRGESADIDTKAVDEALAELRPRVGVAATTMPLPLDLPLREAREQFERAYLQHQLRAVGGRIGELAQRVGMERTHLYRKLKSLGIEYGAKDKS